LSRVAAQRAAEPDENSEGEWRDEVSRRLDQYRVRHGRAPAQARKAAAPLPAEQSGLPFRRAARQEEPPVQRARMQEEPVERPAQRAATPRPRQAESVEICVQPELDFASAARDRARPQTALVPVAAFGERVAAMAIDGIFLALTLAGFVALFRSLGGEISVDKMGAIVAVSVAYLFYALYVSLFITLAGATPGMQLRGLSVVRLDGSLPDTRQLVWRSFGYLLAGGTLLLGFLWALWDEDRFTWQDRISQTYVTAASPLSEADAFVVPVRARRARA
jgi:uncharacterized RDD family membrane protein YckC